MTDAFFRELVRSPSHAVLSVQDLEDLAKVASDMYLYQDTPLNDAVVKVASDHPGISQEQVRRIAEMVNSSTFQRLFEKQASNRNVEFDIADPAEVLRMLDSGASAPIMKVAFHDYASAPPAHRSKDIEADLALCEIFGVTPALTSAMEKSAMIDPSRGQAALELFAKKEQAAKAQKKVIETLMQPPQAAAVPSPEQLGIGGMTQAQPAPMAGMPKMSNAMMGYGGAGGMAGGMDAGMGAGMGSSPPPVMDEGGIVPDDGDDVLHTDIKALPGEIVINPEEEGLTPEEIFSAITLAKELKEENGEPEFEELTEPEEEVSEDPMKEAMAYFKSGRPDSELIQKDLSQFLSLDSIKTAARANDSQYAAADPHGELVRTYYTLQKQAEDIDSAIDENEHHWKMATAELGHHVLQHVLGGGNLGEVVQLMGSLGSQDRVKMAMQNIMPALERRLPAREITRLQAGMIDYEMEKGASARQINPTHPITSSFTCVLKFAEAHDTLSEAKSEIMPLYKEARSLLPLAIKTRVKT